MDGVDPQLRLARELVSELERGVVHIHASANRRTVAITTTKTEKTRRVPIEAALVPLLEAMRAEAGEALDGFTLHAATRAGGLDEPPKGASRAPARCLEDIEDVPRRSPYRPWAELLRRTFGLDVLACPRCEGRRGPPRVGAPLRVLTSRRE